MFEDNSSFWLVNLIGAPTTGFYKMYTTVSSIDEVSISSIVENYRIDIEYLYRMFKNPGICIEYLYRTLSVNEYLYRISVSNLFENGYLYRVSVS